MTWLVLAGSPARAANITWDGGGATNNWSEAANWSAGVPGSNDTVTFDGTSAKPATIDVLINVRGITVTSLYTGTITQASGVTVTVGQNNYTQAGGTFVGGGSTIDFNGAFTLSGGAFTATSGTTFFGDNFTHTGGTFTHNSGTVVFDGGTVTIDVSATETFNNLTITSTGTKTVAASDTLVVTGTLTLTNGAINQTTIPAIGTIDAQGGVTHASSFDGGTGLLVITGTATRTINLTGQGELPGVRLNAPNVTMNGPSSQTTIFEGTTTSFELQAGTFAAGAGKITFNLDYIQNEGSFTGSTGAVDVDGSLTLNGGTLTAPSGTFTVGGDWLKNRGTFTPGANTVTFDGGGLQMLKSGGSAFNNIIHSGTGTLRLFISDLTVNGTFTNSAGTFDADEQTTTVTGLTTVSGGEYRVKTATQTFNGGLTISGGAIGHLAISGGAFTTGSAAAIVVNGAFTLSGGAFTGSTGAVDVNGAFTLSGGAFTAGPGTTFFGDNFTHTGGTFTHNDGTVVFDGGAATIDVPTGEIFNNVTFNPTAGVTKTVAANDTLTVTRTLTLTAGMVNQTPFHDSGTIEARGNLVQATTFEGGTGSLFITGTGNQTFTGGGSTTLGTLPAVTVNKTIGGTLTLAGVIRTTNAWTISAGTVATGTSTLVGTGSFTLSSGATLGIGSTDGITSSGATGNIQVSGSRSYSTGANYTYNGTAAQATGNGLPASVNHLTINNSAGVTASASTTVNGTLTFTSGNVITGSNTIFISSTGSVSRTSGHVVGNFGKHVATGATSRTFEVGTGADFTPVVVAFGNVSVADNLTAKSTAGDHLDIANSGINAAKSVNRSWMLTKGARLAFDRYSATFHFVTSDIDAGANTADFIVAKLDGSTWSQPALGARTGTSTQATGMTSFSEFQVGEGAGALTNFLVEAAAGGDIAPQTAETAFAIRITARDANNNTVTGFTGTVSLTSTATLQGAPVTSGPFVAGVLAFQSVTITSAQAGTTLSATESASGASGTSNAFTVNPAGPTNFLVEAAAGGDIAPQTAGTAFAIRITARDASNNTVTGFTGTADLTTTAGTISPTTVTFAAADNGVKTVSVTVTQSGIGNTITTTFGTGTGTSNAFTVNSGPLDHFLVEAAAGGDIAPQIAGTAFAIQITAQDANNNTVTGFTGVGNTVDLTSTGILAAGGGTTAPFSNGGLASHSVTITNTGTFTLTATRTGGTAAGTSNVFTVNPAPAALIKTAGDEQSAQVGTTFATNLQVRVQDGFGNNVANGTSVTFTVGASGASGTFAASGTQTTIVSTSGGLASASAFTANTITGSYVVFVTSGAAPPVHFNLTNTAGSAIPGPPTVTVQDQFGNPVTDSSVAFNVTGGVPGLARFSIAPVPSPQTAGVAFPITITAQDASGTTLTTFTGGVTLTTTAGAITPSTSGFFVNGTQTEQVTVTQAGLQRTISISDGAGHGGTSNAFHVFPGPATQLAFVTSPGNGTAGRPLPGPPTVAVQDSLGNIVSAPAISITVALGANPAGGSLTGTLTKSTTDGVARFDDLAIDKPGTDYTLSASTSGLSGATSPAFIVVNPDSIPAELNGNVTILSTGQAASFTTGDDLVIQSQSRVKIHFRQPSTIVPQAVTPFTLELQRGQIDAAAQDISLRLATAHGEVRVSGTAEFRLTADAQTMLEVDSGSVQYVAGGGATTVPAGGRLVADASGILSTGLQLTQPLHNALGLFTFLALSNPTSSTADLTLTALDQGGLPLAGAANPRILHLGPGSLFSDVTTSLFGLDPAAPVIGSIRIATPALGVRGASFVGDTSLNNLDSAGLTGQRLAEVVISEEVGELLALVNPGEQPLSITVARVDALGNFAGEISTTLPPSGLQIHLVDDLIGPPPVGGRGTLRLTALDRFTAFTASITQDNLEALPVEPLGSLGDTLFAPFIMDIPGAFTTTLTLVNKSAVPVRTTIQLNDATGKPISGAISSPAFDVLPPGAKRQYTLRDIFQFAGNQTAFGWLEVSAVPTVSSPTARLMGAVSIGDPSGQQFRTTLPLAQAGQSEIAIPFLIEGGGFFSFLALLNPSADQIAIVTLEAVGPDGTLKASQQLRLEPRTSRFGLVRDLLPALSLPFTGALHLRSEGAGIIVGSSGGDDALRFRTILPSQ